MAERMTGAQEESRDALRSLAPIATLARGPVMEQPIQPLPDARGSEGATEPRPSGSGPEVAERIIGARERAKDAARSLAPAITTLARGPVMKQAIQPPPDARGSEGATEPRPSGSGPEVAERIIGARERAKDAARSLAPAITTLARAEGLEPHTRSVEVRLG